MFANSTGRMCIIYILFISNNNDQNCYIVAAKWISLDVLRQLNNENFEFRLPLKPNVFFSSFLLNKYIIPLGLGTKLCYRIDTLEYLS